ncbi:MAG: hypothetical protein E4G93_06115 [Dehalococcoidia bacterium]|nr:MAG: hypothetical protein E4G93_06115 [Dehalococcoidia bacterium]
MDLSPRAQERLARIGALSEAELRQLRLDKELEGALSRYFTGTATTEELWQQVKALSEVDGPDIIKLAQQKITATLRLQMSAEDFEKRKAALLALETLKKAGKYSALELLMGSIVSLRQRYNDVKQQALEQVREQMQAQVQAATEQARRQGTFADSASTMDAALKASPEWRDFVMRHDAAAQKTLDDYIGRIKALL